jgi:hypothetical protein
VALHELGHALGLNHSMENKSVMYPYLQMEQSNQSFTFHEEDVQNIQVIKSVNHNCTEFHFLNAYNTVLLLCLSGRFTVL